MYGNILQILLLYKCGGIITNLTHSEYITDVSKYHSTDIWSMEQNITFYVKKHVALMAMY